MTLDPWADSWTRTREALPTPKLIEHLRLSDVAVNQDVVMQVVTPAYAVGLEAMFGGLKFIPINVKLAMPLAGPFTGDMIVVAAAS